MIKFITKFYLFIGGCLIVICAGIFLLINHVDTLYAYVPSAAENYLHLKPTSLNNLNEDQKNEIIDWLSRHSSLTEKEWETILQLKTREVGLYTLNGQIFGLVKNNRTNKAYFAEHQIDASPLGKVIFFGDWEIGTADLQSLKQASWFKNLQQKILFKDFVLYSNNLKILQLNIPALKNAEIPPMTFLGNINNAVVQIQIIGNIGRPKDKFITNGFNKLPSSTLAYIRNLNASTLAEFNSVAGNLEFAVIQKLPSEIEYFKDSSGSQIKMPKEAVTPEQLKKAILSSLAQIYPARKEKTLPDGTLATHLIADESTWSFVEISLGNSILSKTGGSDTTDPILHLKEDLTSYIVTFGAPVLSGELSSKCHLPKFSQNGIIYSRTTNAIFKNVLIQNKNQKKIEICID